MAYSSARRISPASIFAAMLVAAATSAQASVEISNAPTHNMNCAGGLCVPTAKKAVLNATDLANMLVSGNVTVASNSLAKDIEIRAALNWASAARLTLDAYRSVFFDKAVVVAGTGAALTVTTNDGGAGGDFRFSGHGHVEIWDLTSVLVINGKAFVLVNAVNSLAAAVNSDPQGNYALVRSYNSEHKGNYGSAVISAAFSGSFEGLGNVISNLRFSQKRRSMNSVGLFSAIAAGGVVRDISIVNGSIVIARSVGQDLVGFLAASNSGAIAHSRVSGTVQADGGENAIGGLVAYNGGTISDAGSSVSLFVSSGVDPSYAGEVGALVGRNDGSIEDCSADGNVGLGVFAGGLVGANSGTIANCGTSATVSSTARDAVVGGLAAWSAGTISNSFATGSVAGSGGGGLVGLSQGTISSSYATGAVTATSGDSGAGGLIGFFYTGLVQNSYATGAVYGGPGQFGNGGGLIGKKIDYNGAGDVESCYSTGAVSSGGLAGGVIGRDDVAPDDIGSAYWDLDTSGISNPSQGAGNFANDPGIAGLTTAQFQSSLPAGFGPAIWGENAGINGGYPYLLANPPE